jgi:signal peptidase I
LLLPKEVFIIVKMKYLPNWMKKVVAILSQLFFITLILSGGLVIFHNLYFTPIKIVGSSMEPTLHNQEFGVMDQHAQTLANLSRFDIVIVQQNPSVDRYIIKRIIALPGETFSLDQDGTLSVDTVTYPQPFIPLAGYQDRTCTNPASLGCSELTLTDEEFFVMGDNRGASTDSRSFGPVLRSQIIGKLFAIEGVCQISTSANQVDPNACSNRQYIWPRIYA